ncbi:MAG: hypothetical protein ACI4T2_04345 [Christensenellales bacterium]
MYTKKDFRKDFPQNVMLKKIQNRAFIKSLISYNLINCVLMAAKVGIYSLLLNHIAPTDLYEIDLKTTEAVDMNKQYVKMHEKYDVTHEDIVGLN